MLERIYRPLVLALVGVGLVVWGLRIDPLAAECGSRAMTPGQICDIVGKAGPVRKTYDDMVAERRAQRLWFPVGGGAVVLLAGVWTLVALRGHRRPGDDTADDETTGRHTAASPHTGPHPAPAQERDRGWRHAKGATALSRRGASTPAPAHQRPQQPAEHSTPPRTQPSVASLPSASRPVPWQPGQPYAGGRQPGSQQPQQARPQQPFPQQARPHQVQFPPHSEQEPAHGPARPQQPPPYGQGPQGRPPGVPPAPPPR
ncbi:hypothetical protein GCM10027418_09710 [Mariniluteicoccus endophyticus]